MRTMTEVKMGVLAVTGGVSVHTRRWCPDHIIIVFAMFWHCPTSP